MSLNPLAQEFVPNQQGSEEANRGRGRGRRGRGGRGSRGRHRQSDPNQSTLSAPAPEPQNTPAPAETANELNRPAQRKPRRRHRNPKANADVQPSQTSPSANTPEPPQPTPPSQSPQPVKRKSRPRKRRDRNAPQASTQTAQSTQQPSATPGPLPQLTARQQIRSHQPQAPAGLDTSKPYWWRQLPGSTVDAITLEPLRHLRFPPFQLDADEKVATFFDPRVLSHYLISTCQFVHPISRRVLTREECDALDVHLKTHNIRVSLSVVDAYDHTHQAANATSIDDMRLESTRVLEALFHTRRPAPAQDPQDEEPAHLGLDEAGWQVIDDDLPGSEVSNVAREHHWPQLPFTHSPSSQPVEPPAIPLSEIVKKPPVPQSQPALPSIRPVASLEDRPVRVQSGPLPPSERARQLAEAFGSPAPRLSQLGDANQVTVWAATSREFAKRHPRFVASMEEVLKSFVEDPVCEALTLEPMLSSRRGVAREMASNYNLDSQSLDSGSDRHTVIRKRAMERSGVPHMLLSTACLNDAKYFAYLRSGPTLVFTEIRINIAISAILKFQKGQFKIVREDDDTILAVFGTEAQLLEARKHVGGGVRGQYRAYAPSLEKAPQYARPPPPPKAEVEWTCIRCTANNATHLDQCGVCGLARPFFKPVPLDLSLDIVIAPPPSAPVTVRNSYSALEPEAMV